jgi:hypothetical protein
MRFEPQVRDQHSPRHDPWGERLDEGLKELWESEDDSEREMWWIRKIAHDLER